MNMVGKAPANGHTIVLRQLVPAWASVSVLDLGVILSMQDLHGQESYGLGEKITFLLA